MSYELSRNAIRGGSRSFRIASFFLSASMRRGAYLLYRWCRDCDDVIDNAADAESAKLALERLFQDAQSALEGAPVPEISAHSGLYELHHQYHIPHKYFFELLEGFQMDVDKREMVSLRDLLNYCYHVAGVVGIMMCPILGTQKLEAFHRADSLGRAMQLTNIARDIADDQRLGRVYLPQEWLAPLGLDLNTLLEPQKREALFSCVLTLLNLADEFYQEGRRGLVYLPWRAAWSISVASVLYQRIGWKIRRIGSSAIDQRTILTPLERLWAVASGTKQFIINYIFGKISPFAKGMEQ